VIVVDDGSTDGSAVVARSFHTVRYCFQPNKGNGAARNRGAALARGNVLAFLDADDLWTPHKLERQVAALTEQPGVDAVFGYVEQFHSPELDEKLKAKIRCPTDITPACTPSALLVKRQAFFRVGTFDAGLTLGDFLDWYLRAQELGLKSLMLPDLVLRRRLHQSNLGVIKRDFRRDYVLAIKASLDRRRQKHGSGDSQSA
jgi:glycosyltransferase involved in cell wall biosynthesis